MLILPAARGTGKSGSASGRDFPALVVSAGGDSLPFGLWHLRPKGQQKHGFAQRCLASSTTTITITGTATLATTSTPVTITNNQSFTV